MKETKGIIFDIKRFAIHDGPGIRTTIFFKGCPLKCWWCANPEGQKTDPEKIISPFQLEENDECVKDIIGEEISSQQVIDEILKDRVFYEESSGGVTFSGGEPLMQPEFLHSLLELSKQESIHTILDTSGYAPQAILEKIVDSVDLFLYDIKLLGNEEHMKYTGVSTELILQNLSFLVEREQNIIIRIPIIPGITDTSENLALIGSYLSELKSISRVDILPYNEMSKAKYTRLEKPYELNNIVPPIDERMNEIKEKLEQFGLQVKIGG
ncbi:MAG: glycyl-radical enzyme activating protein [Candidatus Heimdallarchaeota archaeon]|nr:glycyl-radical enzyme activating protein [Candidatus Heimdallarchaeota archaeon]MCK4769648.1 glycyl-radical enzyme activating protein [Candidatus Heimdallarchaeota archaeon]